MWLIYLDDEKTVIAAFRNQKDALEYLAWKKDPELLHFPIFRGSFERQ